MYNYREIGAKRVSKIVLNFLYHGNRSKVLTGQVSEGERSTENLGEREREGGRERERREE